VWALGRLEAPEHLGELERRFRPAETDAMVEAEWAAANGETALALGAIEAKEGRPS
jgi:hypothetical protein